MESETTKQPAQNAAQTAETSGTGALASPSNQAARQCGTATTADGLALSEYHRKLLEARGLSVELAQGLGWRTSGEPSSDAPWLEIPYTDNGREVNCKYRKFGKFKAFRQVSGGQKQLYNKDIIPTLGNQPLVICEGEMDCLAALQCGFKAVSVPDGAPSTTVDDPMAEKYTYLSAIPQDCTVIIAADNDNAGHNLLHDLQIRLGAHRCKWVKYPDDCKDLNEVIQKHGEARLVELLNSAPFVRVSGIYRMSELPPLPEHPALENGIEGISDKFRLRRGDLSVVTGYANSGKSTLIAELMANMANQHGWKTAIASFETSPTSDHRGILRSIYHGRPSNLLDGQANKKADEWIDNNFLFIVPDDLLCMDSQEDTDLAWALSRAAAAVKQYGADMIIIDPWNEIDHVMPHGMSLTQYTGFAIKQFKRFARKYQVHVMIVAHPAKPTRNKDGSIPEPSLYSVSDSAHWANKPDLGLIVIRGDDKETRLVVAKSRYYNILGHRGEYTLEFDDYRGRFARKLGDYDVQ